ncbi:50S ribosomal protein L21 [Patescibacteria group bacterium]|nr:50S ribosomal protein L21 [Patescibacteria group bacterium]
MKYAVIAISGSQYKIEEGKTYTVDLIDAKVGQTQSTDQVLLVVNDKDAKIGAPLVQNASVDFEIIKHYQGDKIRVFKYKGKSRYRKTHGFRSQLTDIKITKITY